MPTDSKAFSALPCSVMPWPTPPSDVRRSTSTTSTPCWASASDRTPPVMPPPTTSTRRVRDSDMSGLLGDEDGEGGGGRGGEARGGRGGRRSARRRGERRTRGAGSCRRLPEHRRARPGDPADDVVAVGARGGHV